MSDAENTNQTEHDMNTITTTQIKNFMMMEASCDTGRYMDRDGCFNYTGLAEFTAFHFDCDSWLDDECHEVWDIAIEVGDKFALNH